MKTSRISQVLFAGAFLFFLGCTTVPHPVSRQVEPEEELPASLSPLQDSAEGSYFYYTEAQLQMAKGNLDKAASYLEKAIQKDPKSAYLKTELAMLYLQQNYVEKAEAVVKSILEKKPDDVDALIILGRISQSQNKIDEARIAYESVIAIDPTLQNIYLLLGDLYMDAEDWSNALRVYTLLTEKFPDAYAGYFYLGKIYVQKGDYPRAEAAFRKTLDIDPELEEPWSELIHLYQLQKRPDLIETAYQDILKSAPDDIRALMGLGIIYHKQGKNDKAQAIFSMLGLKSTTDSEVIKSILQIYIERKNFADAVVILEGMMVAVPDSSEFHYIAGIAYEGLRDREKAIKQFKRISPAASFYPGAVAQVSFWYQEQGKISEAIVFIQSAIQNLPDNPDFRLYLATFYEETGELDKAVASLLQGLKLDPENDQLFFRLGVIYDKMDRKTDSIDAMKSALRLDPKNPSALNYLGYTYADMGQNLDEAEQLIQQALVYKPDDGYITDSLGWVYYKKGLYQQALEYLEKAAKLIPDDPTILEHIGDTYLKLDHPQKALAYYRLAMGKKDKDKEKDKEKEQSDLPAKIKDLEKKGF